MLWNFFKKTEIFFFEIVFYSILVISFLINQQSVSGILIIKKLIFITICLVIIGRRFLTKLDTQSIVIYLAIVLFTGLNFFNRNETYILTDSLIVMTIFTLPFFSITIQDSSRLRFFEYFTLLSIVVNVIIFREGGRSGIGGMDPNFSSLLIFLFLSYLLKMERSKLLIGICLLTGLMTLSRTFLFAMAFMVLCYLIKERKQKKLLFAIFLSLPFLLILSLHIFTLINLEKDLPFIFQISEKLYYSSNEHQNPLRILHIVGNTSDNIRSIINLKTIELMKNDLSFFLFGSNPDTFEQLQSFKMAHNFYLFQLSQSGIFLGLMFIAIAYSIFVKKFEDIHIPILIGFTAYMSFLGIEVGSVYFLLLVFILCIKKTGPNQSAASIARH